MIERLGVEHWTDWLLLGFGALVITVLGFVIIYGIVRIIEHTREGD